MVTMYSHFLGSPPLMPDGTRRIGAAVYSSFWKGYDGIKPVTLIRGSAAHQAWRAGRDTKKLFEKRGIKYIDATNR